MTHTTTGCRPLTTGFVSPMPSMGLPTVSESRDTSTMAFSKLCDSSSSVSQNAIKLRCACRMLAFLAHPTLPFLGAATTDNDGRTFEIIAACAASSRLVVDDEVLLPVFRVLARRCRQLAR